MRNRQVVRGSGLGWLFGVAAISLTMSPAVAEAFAEASTSAAFNQSASREIDRIVGSPLRRLSSDSRARGWAEVGLHARSGDGPGRIIITPVGTAYYQLADPIHAFLTMGAVGDIVLEGDEAFQADAYLGNPCLGFGFDLPIEGIGLQLVGGLALPLAPPGGAVGLSFAEGMRGRWEPWLWSPRRLSPVAALKIDAGGEGSLNFGGELGLAPMFWFGEGSLPMRLAFQAGAHVATMVADVVELGVRGLGVSVGDDAGMQISAEIFANIQGGRNRIYHARLTMPLNEPYGFAFGPGGMWALHVGGGMVF